ncbi:hypothetical protein [uncultured Actinomyces sp.]|jgi:hypothetical protein|uniref:hypothetical protein n=1 Tax=uncultured Actinomyces sp. TaxID=249061 RepID=UPI00262C5E6B|nr:hypothetical protein [uncultured Actinomyces sp.]
MVMINTDDGQAVAPDMQVHYAKWRSWEQTLREEVAPKLRSAANLLDTNSRLQTEGKWSAESGPKAFAAKYEKYLTEEVAALRAMADNAEKFADKISTAIDMLMKNEGDAAGWLDKEAAKIPAVYISDAKQAALDEFDKHPTPSNFARAQKYRY